MSRADNPLSDPPAQILATDLAGTFIPLNNDPQNIADLQLLTTEFQNRNVSVVFVTGRHFASVMQAIGEFELPVPQWIICDVGTSIFQRQPSGEFTPVAAYQDYQDQIIASMPIEVLREQLQSISGLRLQEAEKQGRFKLSFYTDASQLEAQVDQVQHILDQTNAPYSIIHSVDPFNGDGLIDLLPATVSKALALEWWHQENQLDPASTVFSGDSGNDLAALTAGYRTILVGNADRSLAQRVYTLHRQSGWEDRLYLASGTATSAVLEGCRWYGLAAPEGKKITRPGATPVTSQSTHFRVWAPDCKQVHVEINTDSTSISHELVRDHQGYHSATVPQAGANDCYQFLLDGDTTRPDPASRYQPRGVHSVSQIINPRDFPWTDQNWQGIEKRDLVIYELHVGTFTQSGTFRAAIERLPELIELGITAVEIMPVAQSPGRWNWGYDGVDLFAVRNTYGTPDDFRAFIDECHRSGLAVILDVVYNHLGPEGNYLSEFGPYFSDRHHTPWGDAFNYDGPESEHVRQFIVDNAVYWLEDFHLDGLRLDAVHCMYDDSSPDILDAIRHRVSQQAATVGWPVHLFAETNVYNHELLTADQNRAPYDGIWCDCLMYSIYSHALPELSITHRQYQGTADLVETLKHGYVFAGKETQRVTDNQRTSRHFESLVVALQTHDSVGNHPHGKRIHQLTSKAFQKSAAGLVLLYPGIPLIFMGEEFATSAPFPFFVDFEDRHLRDAVDIGRRGEYPPHIWQDALLPSQAEAFFKAKWNEAPQRDPDMYRWYQSLLQLRKQGIHEGWLTAANMQASVDFERNTFTLKYQAPEQGSTITIHTRLTPAAETDASPASTPLTGSLLLSSVAEPLIENNEIQLEANHLVVYRS
jgi:alpha-amylase